MLITNYILITSLFMYNHTCYLSCISIKCSINDIMQHPNLLKCLDMCLCVGFQDQIFYHTMLLSYYVIIIYICIYMYILVYMYTYNSVTSICIDLSKIKLFVFVFVFDMTYFLLPSYFLFL